MSTPAQAARDAKRELARMARPTGEFDARRYFRGDTGLKFYNVGTPAVRALAKAIFRAHRDDWSIDEALEFAEPLIEDDYLDAKAVAIEVLALYRRQFRPSVLKTWRRWLVENHSANWATTDAICGALVGPLLVAEPSLIPRVARWATDRNMWVRRASAVSLIPPVRRGAALDVAYQVAARLHRDEADLIQKAVGWLLREAGKTDPTRLERYLRSNYESIPRTTFRYAIERFTEAKRRDLLKLGR